MSEWIVILLRSIVLFFLILIALRFIGKRSITRISPFNFVTYVFIAGITALIAVNIIENWALGIIALGVWVVLTIGLEYIAMKSKWVHDWVNGKETILIKQGKIMEENLAQVRLTGEELLRELRNKNVFNLADVEFAVLETTGELDVFLKSDKKPLTAHDLGHKVAPQAEPQTVILDGNIVTESLANIGLTSQWLTSQLESTGVSLDNVFLGQVDSSGDLYLDLYNDVFPMPQPKVKELLYANLEKIQADLMTYSLSTDDTTVKEMYIKNTEKIRNVMTMMEPYLLR